ncbi:MAG: HAD family hydrolase [Gammaproteobacteria bacterium]|nr:HAD family hydrolase [Gammaproteobacteria bacterium]
MAIKAAFLDKDGTLLENVPYNVRPEQMRLAPRAGAGLRRLHALGYALIVVSNQPGIALGYFGADALRRVQQQLQALFEANGVPLEGFYYCPHHPDGRIARYATVCRCRKPAPGLLLAAATIHGVDLTCSWMIGDILDDVEAGNRAGCRSVMLDVGNETKWYHNPYRHAAGMATDLRAAADVIALADMSHSPPRALHRGMEL